jgi:hypothetical protein
MSSFLVALLGVEARGGETVGVGGSTVQYPTQIEATIGPKKAILKLTGAAMRKKAIFSVYTIGSYVQSDFMGKSAEALAAADTVKQLHLIMQRDVSGKDMARAFHDAIRANYPGDEFAQEMQKFMSLMTDQTADKGDEVWITHVPGYGLHVNLVGKKAEYIKGVKFGKAVWDIYLGPKNVGDAVKRGLVSRLN